MGRFSPDQGDRRGQGCRAAAATLGINHSTIFRRLGQIEQDLGIKLFERHRSGYALTPAGEEMVAVAKRLDEEITGFTRRLAGQEITPAGELRVTTNDSLLIHLLTPVFARFRAQCRDIRLDIVLSNHALNLSQRDADVAIRATDTPPENLVGRRVARIAWALYGHASDFPQGPRKIDDSLYPRPWVSLGDSLGTLQSRPIRPCACHAGKSRLQDQQRASDWPRRWKCGLGIGHVPCFIADRAAGTGPPFDPDAGIQRRSVAPDPSRFALLGAGARCFSISSPPKSPRSAI